MPELPEVQTVVDDLIKAGLVGVQITGARVDWSRSIDGMTAKTFCRLVTGRTIAKIHRRAKFIILDFEDGWQLLIHLRMTGRLHLLSLKTKRDKHEHVTLDLDNGRQLRFHDTRKFGRFYLRESAQDLLNKLGPEPLAESFTSRKLAAMLCTRHRLLKPLLLDQNFLAGLGNIYVDEALWDARLHPCQRASSLSKKEIQHLFRAIRKVLRRGLKNLGTTLGTGQTTFYSIARNRGRNRDQLNVFRRDGRACPRCKTILERIIVGQRSTHLCPQCQQLRPDK